MRQSLADSSASLREVVEAPSPSTSVAVEAPVARSAHRFAMLDGWRALSILLVLAAHLLPLGPKSLGLNDAVAPMGMALFFTLSGFLITRFLAAEHASVRSFVDFFRGSRSVDYVERLASSPTNAIVTRWRP